jgi:hypothetical protein
MVQAHGYGIYNQDGRSDAARSWKLHHVLIVCLSSLAAPFTGIITLKQTIPNCRHISGPIPEESAIQPCRHQSYHLSHAPVPVIRTEPQQNLRHLVLQ